MPARVRVVDSPLGPLALSATDAGLCGLAFGETPFAPALAAIPASAPAGPAAGRILDDAARRLARYFDLASPDLDALDAIPVDLHGTAFEVRVWLALRSVPPGATITYSGLAERIGRPRAARAVGAAAGHNPVPIVLPCHRVVGADGTLTGFGGGLDRKASLLAHEGVMLF